MSKTEPTPSQMIDAHIKALKDWRGKKLSDIREMIREAAPHIEEQVKWRKPTNPDGVPVWESNGIVCTGETYKDKVKVTFADGAALPDPKGVFNASLDGNVRRAIDLGEADRVNPAAFKSLVRTAVAHNAAKRKSNLT